MGPLDVFIGWQPLLLAVVIYMLTQFVKSVIDATYGKERRRDNAVLNRLVMPSLPPLIGGLLAAFVPIHPQSIIDFVTSNEMSWWGTHLVFAIWGAACGQFADYLYTKVKKLFEDFRDERA